MLMAFPVHSDSRGSFGGKGLFSSKSSRVRRRDGGSDRLCSTGQKFEVQR